jgi:hypothetical protein
VLYVRGLLAHRYHWCRNCPHYPNKIWTVRHQRPAAAELCQACLLRERRNECQPIAAEPLETHGSELLDRLA